MTGSTPTVGPAAERCRRRGRYSTQLGKSATTPTNVQFSLTPRRIVFVLSGLFPSTRREAATPSSWPFGPYTPGRFRLPALVQVLLCRFRS